MTRRRITVVASEVLGRVGTGGAGTADSLLAVALARHGHEVRLLVATGRRILPLNEEWTERYAAAGVKVQALETLPSVRPDYLRPPFEVLQALRADPPDVVIVDEWRGLGSLPLRARQTGVALEGTAFVVHCHSPARVLAAFAQKVPDTLARFGEEVGERASLDLADAVVSPTRWLLDWMRAHGWPVPSSAAVIPYLRERVVLDAAPPAPPERARVRRLAFFGQLREGKGVRIYVEALNALDPSLLDGVELVFLGRETPRWTAETIARALPGYARSALRVEGSLDRTGALDELRRPGTLAVIPSLLDNAPNTVSECIENGIPFVSTRSGGIPELIAEADRDRVLSEPDPTALAAALERALTAPDGVAPARAGRDPESSLQRWLELVEAVAPPRSARPRATSVDVIGTDAASEQHARRVAAHAARTEVRVISGRSRREALERATSDCVLFLDAEDVPDDDLVDRLASALGTDADAVTCAVRPNGAADGVRLFLGNPGALGLVENQYGVLGLVRRELVRPEWHLDGTVDSDWLLFSQLALAGARIVSIPEPLSSFRGRAGAVTDVPGDALAVLEAFEREGGDLRGLPQLAATVAAAHACTKANRPSLPPAPLRTRGLRILREEGLGGLIRRMRSRRRVG
jgi:O-antigen biosynthesis protein